MEINASTDNELVAASLRGERQAFATIVERYQTMVCAVGYSATGDRALSEDVAQDAFIAAWSNLGSLRESGKLRSWLAGIARNLGRQAAKKSGRTELVDPSEADAALGGGATPLEETLVAESEALIWNALRRLPEKNREAMVLYYCEQESVKDVAAILDISEDAVMQRLSRGRGQLKEKVSRLVERTLSKAKPRRGFAAAVLAALPTLGGLPHAQAAAGSSGGTAAITSTHGGVSMFKIGLAFVAMAAVGGTTYVVAQGGDNETDETAAEARNSDAPKLGAAKSIEPLGTAPTKSPGAVGEGRPRPSLEPTPEPRWITSLAFEKHHMAAVPATNDAVHECLVPDYGNRGVVRLKLDFNGEAIAAVGLASLERAGVDVADAAMSEKTNACLVKAMSAAVPKRVLSSGSAVLRFSWRDDAAEQPETTKLGSITKVDSRSRGPANAPVTLVVFHDFKCVFCAKVLGTIDELFDEYPGKLRLVVRQFPLHKQAELAHEAVLFAAEHGKFWEMHDLVMANQDDLSQDALLGLGEQAGLDTSRLAKALSEREYRGAVEAEIDAGREIGVAATPTFLINGKRHTGARSISYFHSEIEAELAKK